MKTQAVQRVAASDVRNELIGEIVFKREGQAGSDFHAHVREVPA